MTTPTTDRIAALELPTTEPEEWRYSRIADLDLTEFASEAQRPQAGDPPSALEAILSAIGEVAAVVVVHNGYVTSTEVIHPQLSIRAGERVPNGPPPADAFTSLHEEVAPEPLLIDVPRGVAVEAPVLVLNWVDADGAISFPRVAVRTAEASEVTVVEWQASPRETRGLVVPIVELHAGDASNLRYLNVQELGPSMWQIGQQWARAGRDATVAMSAVALGGYYSRIRTEAVLDQRGGTADLVAVYFSDRDQMHDFRSLQDHVAERTTSHLLFKGAVTGEAHGVYSGLIRVRAGAKDSDSFLANRNLVLSEHARVDSVPNLEIINENDLRNCGHASATGPIDRDHRFYLESRGVPTEIAERLIILGFFDEVIARTPVPSLRGVLNAAIARKFEAAAS